MKSKELASLLANITHDIKSPLAGIKAIIALIDNELKTTKNLQKISRDLQKLGDRAALINDTFDNFTDLIQIKDQQTDLQLSLFNLGSLVKAVISKISKQYPSSKITLINETDNELVGDKEKLAKAIHTFYRYTQQPAPTARLIKISTESKKKLLTIKISIANIPNNSPKKIDYIYSSEIIKLHGGTVKYQKNRSSSYLIVSLPPKPPKGS